MKSHFNDEGQSRKTFGSYDQDELRALMMASAMAEGHARMRCQHQNQFPVETKTRTEQCVRALEKYGPMTCRQISEILEVPMARLTCALGKGYRRGTFDRRGRRGRDSYVYRLAGK